MRIVRAERRETQMEKVAAEADLAVGLGQNRGGRGGGFGI